MKEILITSSVLILALLILRLVFGKKVRRSLIYGAWALVALRLLVPVQIGRLDFSVLTAAKPVIEAVDERVEDVVLGTTPEAAYRDQVEHYIEKDQTVFVPEVQEQIQQELAQGNQSPEAIYDKIQHLYPEQEILTEKGQELVSGAAGFTVSGTLHAFEVTMLRIWLAGIAVMAIWFAAVNLRHSHMLRQGRKELHCKSILPVYVSEKVCSPCLVGLVRPVIYLTPESAASEETMRHVLTHELTHYAHKDHVWSVVRCVCLCVYWFDPLVWVAAWFSRRDCELACDEGALKRLGEEERIAYGKTLLEVVSHAAAHAHLLQTATAMNETKKQLKERVNFIVKKPKLSIIAAVCMVLVCAIITGCVAAGPMGEQPEVEIPTVDEATIKADAVKHFSTPSDTCKPEEVGLRIISQFGDTYALFVDLPFLMYTQAFWAEKVNDLIFRYSNGQRMYIYVDGAFYTFQEAFDEKIITDDQLTTIWEDYNARGKEPLETTNGTGEVEVYDITVWVPYGMKELTLQQIEAFNQAYAGQYLVNAKVVEETQTIYKVHVVGISAPDLHCFYETDMVSMITNGMVSQLGVKTSGLVRENHHATAVEAASYNGGVYAYPVTATPHMILYYDKSVISEQDVGSLEALIAACENSGRKLSFGLSQPRYASAFFRATGCVSEWGWNESGEFVSVHDTYNSPEGLTAAGMMRTLMASPCYRDSADTEDFGKEVPSAVVISSPGDYMYDAAKGILGDNLGVAQLPAFTADGKRYPLISSGGGLLLGVTPQADVRRQAMLNCLAQYLTNAQCQEERYASLGMWPSQVEAQSNVASSNPCMQIAWDQPCCVMGVSPGSWWALVQDLVSDIAGSEALEEVLERYSKNIAALIIP